MREVKYFCWEELSKLGHFVAIYHDGIWKYGTLNNGNDTLYAYAKPRN